MWCNSPFSASALTILADSGITLMELPFALLADHHAPAEQAGAAWPGWAIPPDIQRL
jgi:hypothetical protein